MLGFGALATRAIAGPVPATGGAPRFAEAAQTVGVTQSAAASVRIVATAAQTVGVTQVATGFGLIVADAAQTIGVTQVFQSEFEVLPSLTHAEAGRALGTTARSRGSPRAFGSTGTSIVVSGNHGSALSVKGQTNRDRGALIGV